MPTSVIPMPRDPGAVTPDLPSNGDPSSLELIGVSRDLIKARFVANIPWWAFFLALCIAWAVVISMFDWSPWWHLLAVPLYLLLAQSIAFTPRRVRALGYATRENDVLYRSGIMFRSLSVMPYGRIQDVEIEEGPIERRFGLSSVTLKSAGGMSSNMTIPGLRREESERIRDLVTREASAKMAAL